MTEINPTEKCELENGGSSLNNENESTKNQDGKPESDRLGLSVKSEVVDETAPKIESQENGIDKLNSHQLSSVNPPLETKELRNQEDVLNKGPSPGNVVLSKRAQKRLEKKKAWDASKAERRAKEREKRKKRKLENPQTNLAPNRKILKSNDMAKSSCHTGVVIDLSFDDFMDEKSLAQCIKQVCRCYSINRRADHPVQFHVCSLEGKSLEEITKHQGYINWDVHFHANHFTEHFDKEKIVYLTSESENVIEKMEDDKIYVIGGLVDHNSKKGLCHKLALEKGLNHARLPISENIDLKTRKVLTIDHVFNVLVNVCNGQGWKEALLDVLPARKGAKEKYDDDDDESNN